MLLRSFRPSDIDTLQQIDQDCFPPGVSYSREELADFIGHRDSRTWVAEEAGAVIGFVIAGRQPQGMGHIVTIDVPEKWRRRGVGTALMGTAEEWMRSQGLKLIYLETAEDNLAAQAFYAARGYQKLERIENYYSDGTAAWVMVKRLGRRAGVGKLGGRG